MLDFNDKQLACIHINKAAQPAQILQLRVKGHSQVENYEVFLTLEDKAGNDVAANGKIALSILDSDNTVLYSDTKNVMKSDFQQAYWLNNGEILTTYSWRFPVSAMKKSMSLALQRPFLQH